MQQQFNQPIFVKVEQYNAYLKKSTSIVLNVNCIRYVDNEYVMCDGFNESLPITKESAKELQDFLLEFYSNAAYQARLAVQPTIQLS